MKELNSSIYLHTPPEKNSDEYLNCDLKYGLSDINAAKEQDELNTNVQNQMEILQSNSDRVKKYFEHKDSKYAA